MVSIKATVMALTLLAVCLLATEASAVSHKCCRSYMKDRIPFRKITGYSVQTDKEMCSINAIIFHTKRGLACTNPAHNWVMDYVNRLRNMAQKVHIETAHEKK
ncbi:C-C motif chemokine 20a.3 [Centropristis striata]|uniref:C-C motif chemokine 20a.3 n=1 Tax=Centropristis striata TaxID=184440 RepID=UPI0027E1C6D8|nr:C-C motif chemokine 20a.3 [Centropristis striata]